MRVPAAGGGGGPPLHEGCLAPRARTHLQMHVDYCNGCAHCRNIITGRTFKGPGAIPAIALYSRPVRLPNPYGLTCIITPPPPPIHHTWPRSSPVMPNTALQRRYNGYGCKGFTMVMLSKYVTMVVPNTALQRRVMTGMQGVVCSAACNRAQGRT